MNNSMQQARRADLLTTVDRPSPAKAELVTIRDKRAKCAQILRKAITRSELKYEAVCDKDHGQLSREIDDKQKLSIHEMFAQWSPEVWRELIPLLAKEFGGEVDVVIRMKESA